MKKQFSSPGDPNRANGMSASQSAGRLSAYHMVLQNQIAHPGRGGSAGCAGRNNCRGQCGNTCGCGNSCGCGDTCGCGDACCCCDQTPLTIQFPSRGGSYTGPTFIATGTAEQNAQLTISINQSGSLIHACANGQWTFPIDTCTLVSGINTLVVSQSGCGCNQETQTARFMYTPVPTVAPIILTPESEATVTPPFEVTGTAGPGNIVQLFGLRATTYTTTADETGMWSIQVSSLDNGDYTLFAVSKGLCGRLSVPSSMVTIQVNNATVDLLDILTPSSGGFYPEGEVLVTGTASAGSIVIVSIPGVFYEEQTLADSTGFWSLLTPPLTGDSQYVIEVRQPGFSTVVDSTFFIVNPLEEKFIFGTVTDAITGLPIVGAEVSVGNRMAITGLGGDYVILELPSFPLEISAGAYGYDITTNVGVVPTDAGTESNFQLSPSGPIPTGTLIVTVFNENTTPAADANVLISLVGGTIQDEAFTNASGVAVFDDLPAGTYDIVATSAYEDFQGSEIAHVIATDIIDAYVVLDNPILPGEIDWIYGQVTSAQTELPIAGATVIADEQITTTDESGDYVLEGLPPTQMDVSATAEGYVVAVNPDVLPSEFGTQSNFELTPETAPTGAIVTVLNEDLEPATGASVTLTNLELGYSQTELTNETGEATFDEDVLPGSYEITATSPNGTMRGHGIAAVSANMVVQETVVLDTPVILGETGWIFGHVLDAETEEPVIDALVSADGETVPVTLDGHYIISELPDIPVDVIASAPGYETAVNMDVVPSDDGTQSNFELIFEQPEPVLFVLYEDDSPSPGADVSIQQLDGSFQQTRTADAQGIVSIADLPSGNYAFVATTYEQDAQGITVAAVISGETDNLVVFVDIPATPGNTQWIYGQVIDDDSGLPILGATVTANGETTITDSSDFYVLMGLSASAVTITASAEGYDDDVNTGVIPSLDGTESNFSLTPTAPVGFGNLEITVLNQDTSSAEGATVTISRFGDPFQITGTTNAVGVATLNSLPTGILAIVATSADGDFQGSDFETITLGDTVGVTITLNTATPGASAINWAFGTVVDAETGQPILGATIESSGSIATTDARGMYMLIALLAQPQNFTASADGYDAQIESSTTPTPSGVNISFALYEL